MQFPTLPLLWAHFAKLIGHLWCVVCLTQPVVSDDKFVGTFAHSFSPGPTFVKVYSSPTTAPFIHQYASLDSCLTLQSIVRLRNENEDTTETQMT